MKRLIACLMLAGVWQSASAQEPSEEQQWLFQQPWHKECMANLPQKLGPRVQRLMKECTANGRSEDECRPLVTRANLNAIADNIEFVASCYEQNFPPAVAACASKESRARIECRVMLNPQEARSCLDSSSKRNTACLAKYVKSEKDKAEAVRIAAQPKEWQPDSKGCKVWNPNPQPNETITWSGGCVNGLAEGEGILVWFKDGKQVSEDKGTFRAGKLEGPGVSTFPGQSRYEGDFVGFRRQGRGTMSFGNGNRYEGDFEAGTFHGRGIYTFMNGDRYEGDFSSGTPNGPGTLTTAKGQSYSGTWTKGCLPDQKVSVMVKRESCGF
jgi:hypothetical protein